MTGLCHTRMALLTFDDIQAALNIDLTNPNGQERATDLIEVAIATAEREVGYPLEQTADQVAYFEDGQPRMWLDTKAPVSALTIATYDEVDDAYDTLDATDYRSTNDGQVYAKVALPTGFQAVKVTYTAGWTAETLPRELRQALITIVGLLLQEVSNYSSNPADPAGDGSGETTGALRKVEAIDYTEEYDNEGSAVKWKAKLAQLSRTIGDDLPPRVKEVFAQYRKPFAL